MMTKGKSLLWAAAVLVAGASVAEAGYIDAVDALNPVVHYRFSETTGATGTPAADANLDGGAAYHATYNWGTSTNPIANGMTLGLAGPRASSSPTAFTGFESDNTSVLFDGANNQQRSVTLPGNTTLNDAFEAGVTTTGISFQAWVKTTQTNRAKLFHLAGSSGSSRLQIELNTIDGNNTNTNMNETDGVRVFIRNSAGNVSYSAFFDTTSVRPFTDDQWHLLTVVASGGASPTLSLYVDTQAFATTVTGSGFTSGIDFGTGVPYVGNDNGSDARYTGLMDEFSIYTKALTKTEVTSVYNASFAPIPEPASLSLLGLASLGLLLRRRHQA